MKHTSFSITGMSCGGCVNRATRALASLPGVTVKNVAVGAAEVLLEDQVAFAAAVIRALEAVDFTAKEIATKAGAPSRGTQEISRAHN